jgi:rsbT co-antagonist protein RsbR
MSSENGSRLSNVLERYESEILSDWMKELTSSGIRRDDLMKESELRQQAQDFLRLTRQAATGGARTADIQSPHWSDVRDLLADMSRSRAAQGFTSSQTANFILSFKRPLFTRLKIEAGRDTDALATGMWDATDLLDKLGLFTTEVYQKAKEEIINRQQQDMLELSTPVVKLWEGVLALPMIGTLDSARTQVVMETLLQRIVDTGAEIAIIDITGVPTVDTLVAQHLLKTVTAARLMGADCIISGIRPQIAQTIVHLGVNLGDVTTKATLADAFTLALQRVGFTIRKPQQA